MIAVFILLASLMVNHVKAMARDAVDFLHAVFIQPLSPAREFLFGILLWLLSSFFLSRSLGIPLALSAILILVFGIIGQVLGL